MSEPFFKNIRQVIRFELEKAEHEIKAAIGWFTNRELFDLLCVKAKAGVRVQLVVLNDYINNREGGLEFQQLIDLGWKFLFWRR
jgi:hypothetical protein